MSKLEPPPNPAMPYAGKEEQVVYNSVMFMSEEAMCEQSRTDGVCGIMVTGYNRFDLFGLSLASLLLRSSQQFKHIFVVINGPRRNQKGCEEGDKRQKFLEALEDAGAPVTVIRVWGHVGHAQCLDMAAAWVWTKRYLVMHDDVLVLNPSWYEQACSMLDAGHIAAVLPNHGSQVMCGLRAIANGDQQILTFPHPNTAFTVVDTATIASTGHWRGYHLPIKWNKEEHDSLLELVINFHKEIKLIDGHTPAVQQAYDAISHDVGAWLLFMSPNHHDDWVLLPADTAFHVERASWDAPEAVARRIHERQYLFDNVVHEIRNSKYAEVYRQFGVA